jgi:hypothetical protein
MKHMKPVAAVGLAAMLVAACSLTKEELQPEQAATYGALLQAEADAALTPGLEDDEIAAANLAAFEKKILQERAGTVVAFLSGINPMFAAASPLVGLLVPLLGKRGRKHAKKAVANINPWSELGGKSINVGEAVASLGKMWGIKHSDEKERVEDGVAPPAAPAA